ncbi:hypothetical protein TrVE_jg14304 [Triparma verrucosa]|uniref:Uncharacterized protein n=1 Tax=Triparma verrucosa TaxID=1606542 RepID=A0A9W7F3F3_9STRA|nr:hypothetical protein TrVE_jg14304 [Triparma verrucosa]
MAFHQPLASDTPSSNFARHPILGAIVWLFGGKEDQDQKLSKNLTGSTINNSSEDSLSGHSSGGSSENMNIRKGAGFKRTNNIRGLGDNGRRMSWSDESGQNLVEVFDLSKQNLKKSSNDSVNSLDKPVKSAMKRSTSTLGGAVPSQFNEMALSSMSPSSAYESTDVVCSLPKTGDRVISPAQQYFNKNNPSIPKSSKSGQVSPQWGWYISTTPPVQQMFEKEVPKKAKGGKGAEPGKSGLAMALGQGEE